LVVGKFEAQSLAELRLSLGSQANGARHSRLYNPTQFDHAFEQRSAERTSEVVATLRKVKALRGKQPVPGLKFLAIDSHLAQPSGATGGHFVAFSSGTDDILALKGSDNLDSEFAR
jgi:hypothetical protein